MYTHVLQRFFFKEWHTESGPLIQQSFCIKLDSSLTGAMHHHTSLRKILCCVYMCLPSSWFLNLGSDAWRVLEIGIYLLLCNPNEANCISYKIILPCFLFSFYHLSTFSSLFSSFLLFCLIIPSLNIFFFWPYFPLFY